MFFRRMKIILFKLQYVINLFIKFRDVNYIKQQRNVTIIYDHGLGGGTTKFVNENLIKSDQDYIILNYKIMQKSIKLTLISNGIVSKSFSSISLEDLKLILNSITLKHVIVNHLIGFRDISRLIELIIFFVNKNNCNLDYYCHDYYALCPSVNLINDKEIFCRIPNDVNICDCCLKNNSIVPWFSDKCNDIMQWRRHFSKLLNLCSSIFVFSDSSIQIFTKVYPEYISKVKKYVVMLDTLPKLVFNPNFINKKVINIGVLGNISKIKGLNILRELTQILSNKFKLMVIGNTDYVVDGLYVSGSYDRKMLVDLAKNIDLFILPSICPETYCYSADEVMQMGFPIICFDIGAPVERVTKYQHGYTVANVSAEDMYQQIINVAKIYNFKA